MLTWTSRHQKRTIQAHGITVTMTVAPVLYRSNHFHPLKRSTASLGFECISFTALSATSFHVFPGISVWHTQRPK